MASNEIKLKLRITEEGDLEIVGKKAKKTADAVNDAAKASDNYNKKQKGVGQLTNNSTKAFAKMTTGITSGLVPAYATLAANLFAVSAAFNFFKRAADLKILEEGQKQYAASTGLALQNITSQLREASGGMLGFREAAEAAAIGVAKGFSPQQLNDLAEGARKASTALGRNFEDSFDRLIRGASKAEPELLDELGITLRLETATKNYAAAMGIASGSLTEFERSQAVLIETQRQLNDLFGDVEGASNPFVVLAKTFEDIVKAGTNALLPMFEGIANIINRSAVAAIAVFGAIAVALVKMMFPLDGVKKGFQEFQMDQENSLNAAIAKQNEFQRELDETKQKIQNSKVKSVSASAGAFGNTKSKLLQKAQKGELTDPKQIGMLKAHLKKAEAEYAKHNEIKKGMFAGADAKMLSNLRNSLNLMDKQHMTFLQRRKAGFKQMSLSWKVTMQKMKGYGLTFTSQMAKGFTMMGNAMNKAMKMAGFIGMIMMIIELGRELLNAPYSIVMSLLKGVDTFVGMLLKGVGMMADTLRNLLAPVFNFFIDKYNVVADSMVGSKLGMTPIKEMKEDSTAAQDAMENLARTSVNLADSFKNSGYGEMLRGFQERRIAAQQEAEAYDELKNKIIDVADEMRTISEGIAGQRGAKREQSAATALGSLGLSGLVKKAIQVEDEDKRANAIANLRREFKDLATISPRAAQLLQDLDVNGLQKLEASAQTATAGVQALKNGINNLASSLSSGDLYSAETVLEGLFDTSKATSAAFKRLFGGDSKAAKKALADFINSFPDGKVGADAFLNSVKELRIAQEQLNIAMAKSVLVGGQYAETFKLMNAAEQARLAVKRKELEIQLMAPDDPRRLKAEQELAELKAKSGAAQNAVDRNKMGDDMGAALASAQLADQGMQAQISPILGQLEKLGPEGELVSSVVNGAFSIQEAFTTAFEKMGADGATMTDKIQAGLAGAAQVMQAVGQMMAAGAKARVADIDKQIEAEKKRDGKSKESVQKIKALEKKKEQIERKAFEQQKKMKMASVVASTAMAIMKESEKGFPAAIPGIAMFAALGAAQLAIISKTSYQGGGNESPSEPSQVSVGARQNTVDLARARSPAGELAYARGASGTGEGMTNYKPTPAFTGAKYRAAGGSASFMVGEQGPELFVPSTPGNIIPADEVQNTGPQPMNINFTVQAIDGVSVQEMLLGQRGNIIGMIRDAANASGEPFIESVNVLADSEGFGNGIRN